MRWFDDSTMVRVINEYLRANWDQIKSDLALNGEHNGGVNTGSAVGEGFVNSGTAAAPNPVYTVSSLVRISIRFVPGTPPDFYIITAFPTPMGVPWPRATMDDKLKQKLAEQLARKPAAMDTVREFLQYQVWGAEPEDVQRSVVGLHAVNPYRVGQIIDALEEVAVADHPAGTLSQLVMIDGNQMLMDESDDGARAWMRELAARMRGWTTGAAGT